MFRDWDPISNTHLLYEFWCTTHKQLEAKGAQVFFLAFIYELRIIFEASLKKKNFGSFMAPCSVLHPNRLWVQLYKEVTQVWIMHCWHLSAFGLCWFCCAHIKKKGKTIKSFDPSPAHLNPSGTQRFRVDFFSYYLLSKSRICEPFYHGVVLFTPERIQPEEDFDENLLPLNSHTKQEVILQDMVNQRSYKNCLVSKWFSLLIVLFFYVNLF